MKRRHSAIVRIRCLSGLVIVVALLLIGRLYQLQVIDHDDYVARAERQYVHTVEELYDRGSIFFQTKDDELVSAASIQSGYVLAVNPTMVSDPSAYYDALSEFLTVDRDTFIKRATLPNRTYVEIEATLPKSVAEPITALELDGVSLYRNQWRFYPAGSVAARTVGFVGRSNDDAEGLIGRYGLERYYEDVLTRENERISVNFFAEIFTNVGHLIFDSTPTRTGDVVTTIEPTVARLLDQTLEETQEEWGSTLTGGIIINPQTGAIYAMNAVPTYDLNDRSGLGIEAFQNPLVENVY